MKHWIKIEVDYEGPIQFFPALEMFVVVEEIIAALAPCAMIYTAVFAGLWGMRLTEGACEWFRCEGFIVGR